MSIYRLLGLTNKDATTEEIHEKYRAIQANPRVGLEVRRAYDILLDPAKKAEYDRNLQKYEEQIKRASFYNMLLTSARLGNNGHTAFILETYLFDKQFDFAAFEKQFGQFSVVVPLTQNQIEKFLKEVLSSHCNPLLKIKIFNSVKKLRPKLDWSLKRYLPSNISIGDHLQDLNQLTTQIYLGLVLFQAEQFENFKKLECKNIEECWELWLDIPEDSDSVDYLQSIFDILISSGIEFTAKNVKDTLYLRKDPLIQHFNIMMDYARQKEKFSLAALSDIAKHAYLASDRPNMQAVLRKLVLDFPGVDYAQILKSISRDVWTFKSDPYPVASRSVAYRFVPDQGKKFRSLSQEVKLLDPINEDLIITDVAKTLKKPNLDIAPLIDFNLHEPDDQSDEQENIGIGLNEQDDVLDTSQQDAVMRQSAEVLESFVEQFVPPAPIVVDEETVSDLELIDPEIYQATRTIGYFSQQTAESLLALDLNETLMTDEFPHVSTELCGLYAKGKIESMRDLLEEIARSNPRSLKNFRDQLISGLKTLEDIDWIDIAMDIFLKRPSNPTRLNALVETMKIFYRAGLKFTDQHLDKMANHNNLFSAFCKGFGYEAAMICLGLLRADILCSSEIHLAMKKAIEDYPGQVLKNLLGSTTDAKLIHTVRLMSALLACDDRVYKERRDSIKSCYEFLRQYGADTQLFISIFKKLLSENKFSAKHLSLWNIFYEGEKEKLQSMHHDVIIITSGIMDLQIKELIRTSAINFDILTLQLLKHAYTHTQDSLRSSFFNLILTHLTSYAGSQEKLQGIRDFLAYLVLSGIKEDCVFHGVYKELQTAMKKIDAPASLSAPESLERPKESKGKRIKAKTDKPGKKSRSQPTSTRENSVAPLIPAQSALPVCVPVAPVPQTESLADKSKSRSKKRELWGDFKAYKHVEKSSRPRWQPKEGSASVKKKNTSEYAIKYFPPIVKKAMQGIANNEFFKPVVQPKPRQGQPSFIPAAALALLPDPSVPVAEKPEQSHVAILTIQGSAFFQQPVENPPPPSPSKRQAVDGERQPLRDNTNINPMRIDFITM